MYSETANNFDDDDYLDDGYIGVTIPLNYKGGWVTKTINMGKKFIEKEEFEV